MEPSAFDEVAFFSALHRSGARAIAARPKDLEDIRLLRILRDART